MNQKIIITGDTHGDFGMIEKIFQKENVSGEVVAILHAGDLGVYDELSIGTLDEATGMYSGRLSGREIGNILRHKNPVGEFLPYIKGEKIFPVPVYNIAGNHEDFALYEEILNGKVEIENFIPMHPCKVYTIEIGKEKLNVAGLGKIYPRIGSNRFGKQHITDNEYNQMWKTMESNKIDIFLLHEALFLSTQRRNERWMSFGNPKITELIQGTSPLKVFIGHMHFEYTYSLGKTNIWGLGYGVVGRYAVLDSDLNVNYFSLSEERIRVRSVKEGNVGYYLNEERKTKEIEQRKEEKRIRKEMKRNPYDLTWLKTIVPVHIKSKEDKKSFAPLFLEISRMFYGKRSEEEIILYAKKWMAKDNK